MGIARSSLCLNLWGLLRALCDSPTTHRSSPSEARTAGTKRDINISAGHAFSCSILINFWLKCFLLVYLVIFARKKEMKRGLSCFSNHSVRGCCHGLMGLHAPHGKLGNDSTYSKGKTHTIRSKSHVHPFQSSCPKAFGVVGYISSWFSVLALSLPPHSTSN